MRPSFGTSVERPNPTIHASKLMQTRRKLSGRIFWMSTAPIGTPMAMLGRM